MTAPTIYHAHPISGEYLSKGIADPDPLDPDNWLIPGFAYLDAPPKVPQWHVAKRSADKTTWEPIEDNRGTVYNTGTGFPEEYTRLGGLPAGLSRVPRPSVYHRWSGTDWVLDEPAQRSGMRLEVMAQRDDRLYVASLRVAPLQDAVDLGRATAAEQVLLVAWKDYRVDLARIEQQEGFPLAVEWPPSPEDGKAANSIT
ncbi:hypothetical protein EXN22_07645 [Pseudomonas tructae]|uniref:Tail fiber assembly protein n=1 Tax=Pseudomonas tructae TaxID=2518644 RepID=A0A411MFK0_9PSED|nr:tail fiber assembly protein [Pseudomonas tructae]QBF25577.1 hypothetical protein EXN22_07645 [Pseudomonas tructae]